MIQVVVKRDGRVTGYNEEKIKAAIRKAMFQTEKGEDEALINVLLIKSARAERSACRLRRFRTKWSLS